MKIKYISKNFLFFFWKTRFFYCSILLIHFLDVQFCPIYGFFWKNIGCIFEMIEESRLIRCVLHNLGVFRGVFSVTHFDLELCVSYTCQLSVWFATSWHHPLTKLSFVEMLLFTQNHYLPEHRKLELNKRKTIQMTT